MSSRIMKVETVGSRKQAAAGSGSKLCAERFKKTSKRSLSDLLSCWDKCFGRDGSFRHSYYIKTGCDTQHLFHGLGLQTSAGAATVECGWMF